MHLRQVWEGRKCVVLEFVIFALLCYVFCMMWYVVFLFVIHWVYFVGKK